MSNFTINVREKDSIKFKFGENNKKINIDMGDSSDNVREKDSIKFKFGENNKKINIDMGDSSDNRYKAGNGIIIQYKTISIDPELILDCGTSTTVLQEGVI